MAKYLPVQCTCSDKWNKKVLVLLLHVHWMCTLYTFIQEQVNCMIINPKLHYNNNNGV